MKIYNESPKNKREADARANDLVNYLNNVTGGNWKKRVWENLGWHYAVRLGSIEVYAHSYTWRNTTYNALVGDTIESGGGLGIWTDSNSGFEKPEEAVRHAMNNAKTVVDKLHSVIYSNIEQLPKLNFES